MGSSRPFQSARFFRAFDSIIELGSLVVIFRHAQKRPEFGEVERVDRPGTKSPCRILGGVDGSELSLQRMLTLCFRRRSRRRSSSLPFPSAFINLMLQAIQFSS